MTWEELLANRIPMPILRNSAHMMKCRAAVLAKYPNAQLVDAGKNLWKLQAAGVDLSNAHNSHYACWAEAQKLMGMVS